MLQKINGGSFLLIALLSLVIFFFYLGGIPLLDPDEPVYAQTPKEMLAFSDLISPRIYGEFWYDKPPMYYWLVAGAYQLFGINEFAARFPSALLGLITVLYIYQMGTRLFGERAGFLSAMILATSIEFFYLGKAAVTDMTLTFCLTVALLSFIDKRYYLFYIFAGLATVTKGPVGILFPAAIIFIYLLVTRRWHELTAIKLPQGIFIFAAVALPWYVAMYQLHGAAFIDTFIGFHNVTRFTSPEHPEGVLWYYFIPVLILGFFPWSAVAVQAVWASIVNGNRAYSKLTFLNCWAWFIFLFFTISRTKLVSYILPMFPPLAMIVGWHIATLLERRTRHGQTVWAACLLVLGLLLAAGSIIGSREMPQLAGGAYATAAVFGLMAVVSSYWLWKNKIKRAFALQVAAMAIFSVIFMTMLLPAVEPVFSSRQFAKEFQVKYDGQAPVYIAKFLRPGLAFYADFYGIEIESNWGDAPLLAEVVATEKGKAYFIIQRVQYNKLSPGEQQKLTVLVQVADNMLLVKE